MNGMKVAKSKGVICWLLGTGEATSGRHSERGSFFWPIRIDLQALSAVAGLFLLLFCVSTGQTAEPSSPQLGEQETGQVIERTIVHMPFASLAGNELISTTRGSDEDRRWLVHCLASGELRMMHQACPRFPVYWDRMWILWSDELTYTGTSVRPAYQVGFPKWRVNQGRLIFYWGSGFSSLPFITIRSGFFLIPYQDNAPDYRLSGWGATTNPDAEKSFRSTWRIEDGRLHVQSAAFRYRETTRLDVGSSARNRQIIPYLDRDRCAGADFVITSDSDGLFFTCSLSHGMIGEDLTSKMNVFDFTMRDEEGIEFQRVEGQSAPFIVLRDVPKTGKTSSGFESVVLPEPPVPEALTTMEWIERESFEVPFSVPFTVAVDDDCYFFVTNGGAIYRAPKASNGERQRVCERIYHQPENPILACIHDASTNRIFAFRRDSYIPVDSEHFPQDESPRFIACPDITRCEQLFYNDEVGMQRSADARFRLLSEAARVLRGQLQGATQTED